MSRNEWEFGTIVLPASAVASVKAAIRESHNKYRDALIAEVNRIWVSLPSTRSVKLMDKALTELDMQRYTAAANQTRAYTFQERRYSAPTADELFADAMQVIRWPLQGVPSLTVRGQFRTPPKVRKPTAADVDQLWHIQGKATNKTVMFRGGEATVTFNGRTVTWDVPENNHAVDRAHESRLGAAFFGALDKVVWTRGTGGELVGNDENSCDSRDSGGGSNYTTAEYPPPTRAPVRLR